MAGDLGQIRLALEGGRWGVVVRPGEDRVASALGALGCEVRVCGDADTGMAASLTHAIDYSKGAEGWVIALGDMPHVRPATVARVVSMWHVSQFLVAEIDGRPAAALCALPAAGTGPAAWRAIEEVAATTGLAASELDAIRKRGIYTRACWVQGGEGDWMLEHVATDPAYRGRGLVQALIAHALDKGLAAGFTRATISFLADMVPSAVARAAGKMGGGTSLDNSIRYGAMTDTDWILLDMDPYFGSSGYLHGAARIWAQDGTLVAVASQTATAMVWEGEIPPWLNQQT